MVGPKTVLSMMDEALYIYSQSSGKTRFVDVVPWTTEGFEAVVSHILKNECKAKPVIILNDMVEQHYRKERVLTSGVGALDRKAMVDRKLKMAFPGYSVCAALPLKEKISKEGGAANASDVFIFAAVPDTAQLKAVTQVVKIANVSVSGFGLLPVESAGLVNDLVSKNFPSEKKDAKWNMMIVQHKNGGLRQIVTKNGEIALTRMTPVVDSDQDPQQWASEVVQEFRATMSYLTRFGFQINDGLNIILIGNEMPSQIVGQSIDERLNFMTLTPDQAAKSLKLSIGIQEKARYGDILHMAWVAKKARLSLPLPSKALQAIAVPRLVANLSSIALVLSAAFFIYQTGIGFVGLNDKGAELEEIQGNHRRVKSQYDEEVAKKEALGINIRLIQSAISVKEDLDKENINPLSFVNGLSAVLGRDLRVDKVSVMAPERDDQANASPRSRRVRSAFTAEKPRLFEAILQIEYPETANPDEGNRELRAIVEKVGQYWPSYKVTLEKELLDYQYVEEITIGGDPQTNASQDVKQDFIAEIKIEGPEIND